MHYSTADVIDLIERLEKPFESETVELKEARSNFSFKDLGRYFSALSNEAALRGRQDAWLFFGVDDDKSVCGTRYRAEGTAGLRSLKREMASCVNNRLTFREIHELKLEGRRVLAFQIPAAVPGFPTAFNNAAWAREGESLVPLPIDKYEQLRSMPRRDWSATIIEGAGRDDLDPQAVAKALELFGAKHARHKGAFAGMDERSLLDKASLTRNGKITACALVLVGRPESVHLLGDVSPRITWTLYASDGSVTAYEHFRPPLLLAVDQALAKIRNERYRFIADETTLFPTETLQYEPEIIRELLHNCIAHQDYAMQGRINVEEFEDHLVFMNEGSFIPGTIENAMQPGYKPSRYRNPFLCEAMIQLDMIDTIAMGIPKVFQLQRSRLFPLPTYDLDDPGRVSVSVYGKLLDPNYSRLLRARPDLPMDAVFLLDKVQKGSEITQQQAERLQKLGAVEGEYPNVAVASASPANGAAATGDAARGRDAAPVSSRPGFDPNATPGRSTHFDEEACKAVVIRILEEDGPASRSKIASALYEYLPDALSGKQKARKVSNLLAKMKNVDGTIEATGTGKTARWHAR